MEAAVTGCAILHGPDIANCLASTAQLDHAGASLGVSGQDSLTTAVEVLLTDPDRMRIMGQAAQRVVAAERLVLREVMMRLLPLLPRPIAADARA